MIAKFLRKLLLTCSFVSLSVAQAAEQGKYLNQIKMPASVDNIHVVKLASDQHSTDFVVFVRKQVPAHKHLKHSETVYVLEGQGLFTLDGVTTKIGPGHYIKIPQGVVHSVVTTSKQPLKVLSVQAPEFFGKDRVMVK